MNSKTGIGTRDSLGCRWFHAIAYDWWIEVGKY
jgi:hypothetical protein